MRILAQPQVGSLARAPGQDQHIAGVLALRRALIPVPIVNDPNRIVGMKSPAPILRTYKLMTSVLIQKVRAVVAVVVELPDHYLAQSRSHPVLVVHRVAEVDQDQGLAVILAYPKRSSVDRALRTPRNVRAAVIAMQLRPQKQKGAPNRLGQR